MMCMTEYLSWISTEMLGQAPSTNQCWPNSVLIDDLSKPDVRSLSDCHLLLSNCTMLSLHVLPTLNIWKLISVQVDHSCSKGPCFNLRVSYLCNVIMLLPMLMMVYTYGVYTEINILLTLILNLFSNVHHIMSPSSQQTTKLLRA